VSNVNLINPIGILPDGRPIYSTAISAATRVDPRFNAIFSTQSIGDSTYKGLTLQFTRRFSRGIQWDLAYTLGKSEDNTPAHGTTLVVMGDTGGRSDPANLDTDLGPNILDQRHTFVGSIVAQPQFDLEGVGGAILNNNQFGIAIQMANGIPVTLRSNRELNNDAIGSDRPVDVTRNSYRLPARRNVDLRYTRLFPVGTTTLEFLAEVKNVFNSVQWMGATSVVATDVNGVPTIAIPAPGVVERDAVFQPNSGHEQRQLQLGFRVTF
jgi:hypothetical protein